MAEYSKRISRFAKFEMIELSDEKTPDKASESENQKILEIEGQRILSKIADRDFVIVLAIEGKTFFSEEFSKQLEETSIKGFSTLTFIIGGSLGLSSSVKNRANLSVSFGRLTLPHQLMRLVLVEQIYRAFTIQQGFPYHK
ncbi:TPA: 23S rRNA (pseudouridine(1915)-N(3))-methyltransferase RlmH [Streptococcus pneumoniae]|uniref:23S rRNA (pseudouridine(1915)-N(3))-methyltransferase RlmH n=1 Tax=Streptococcus pneumoniae TaxID=1313 RepID=UPI001C6381BB|nr:23S rRNA (pseudouridine(1915)-N(3))-methyltransferase RlmH [Streptococcus pneumoniae]MBW7539328.1 23S rRNA (pseudouridine(1915)-N(3))-methyltransferase RlmH [Streptococcus pneumoniae]HEW2708753.1 23S rRNA (pseudouridine(1915)-N(3))-methyltransferase RlmH [Streptococcus pneumoniae]